MIEITSQDQLKMHLEKIPKVLALFYASWCPFCRSFLPIFNLHSQMAKDSFSVRVKIDEDDNPLWEEYSLDAVPSIILFENGKVIKRLDCKLGEGLDQEQFTEWLSR